MTRSKRYNKELRLQEKAKKRKRPKRKPQKALGRGMQKIERFEVAELFVPDIQPVFFRIGMYGKLRHAGSHRVWRQIMPLGMKPREINNRIHTLRALCLILKNNGMVINPHELC